MNSIASYYHPRSERSSASYCHPDDLDRMISTAKSILDQAPPPTLREILGAYRSKGDGDRDMLLAMLNAKTAEDQRLASMASLHRSVLEVYQHAPDHVEPLPRHIDRSHDHYSSYTQSSRPFEQRPRRVHQSRGSRSPHRPPSHLPPIDSRSHHLDHSRKRRRSSHSPHSSRAAVYEASHSSEQFPPSPYSSSDRSDSAEYSPRTRASMAIGSLLSSGPRREMNEDTSQERD